MTVTEVADRRPGAAVGRLDPWRFTGRKKLIAGLALLGAVTVFFLIVGFPRVFTGQPLNDDEGYLVVALREFVRHGNLYDETYTQYGPFYYATLGPLFQVIGGPDLTSGRIVSELMWVATSTTCGLIIVCVTRRWLLGVLAQVCVFWYLGSAASEHLHPGLYLAALLAMLVLALSMPDRPIGRARAPIVGGLLAALCLTKINVGGFAVIAVFVLMTSGAARAPRWLRFGAVAVMLLLPWVLLRPDLGTEAFLQLAAVAFLANLVLAFVLFGERAPGPTLPWKGLGFGAMVVALGSIGYVLATGTSVSGLWNGVIVRPLDQRRNFFIEYPPDDLLPVLVVLVALVPVYLAVRRRASPPIASLVSGAVAAGVGILLFVSLVSPDTFGKGRLAFIPLAGVLALPPVGIVEDGWRTVGRRALAAVGVLQLLHVYPVAGSHRYWATFLVLALTIVAFNDALVVLRLHWRPVARVAAVAVPVVLALVFVVKMRPYVSHYRAAVPIAGVSGARWVHTNEIAHDYEDVTTTLRNQCDTFFSAPGMNTFYVFADLSPPTGFNAGMWPTLLEPEEQRAVVESLRSVRRLCVIRSDVVLNEWFASRPVPDGPLLRYLDGIDREISRAGHYVVAARR